jgi:hypothetical protein
MVFQLHVHRLLHINQLLVPHVLDGTDLLPPPSPVLYKVSPELQIYPIPFILRLSFCLTSTIFYGWSSTIIFPCISWKNFMYLCASFWWKLSKKRKKEINTRSGKVYILERNLRLGCVTRNCFLCFLQSSFEAKNLLYCTCILFLIFLCINVDPFRFNMKSEIYAGIE